ncbi:MAG: BrnT family toxin [Paracoccaceae bacterium]
MLDWDDTKRRTNLAKHGVDFAEAERFDWTRVVVLTDTRRDYGEVRLRVFGMIGERLHVLVFAQRGAMIRVIRLRRANGREFRLWNTQGR